MPPYSNVRQSSAAATTATMTEHNSQHSANVNGPMSGSRRTTASGRAVRANTTRPANYYARPFGGHAVEQDVNLADNTSNQALGFFPALTYFTDAITALPRETMKHFTLMKEVEAKIYNPTDQLGTMIDALLEQPVPTRSAGVNAGGPATSAAAGQGLLSLTATNSMSGSANASLVNGVGGRHSAQASTAGSLDGVELPDEEEKRRRTQYHELRGLIHSMLANLDEKIVVLNEANCVLAQQHLRLDSVMPGIEEELSEAARLGSMTHWAYSDNRQKTKAAAVGANRPRDVAATNNLAAAANMLHEAEIAQARTDAGKEAARGKPKAKRALEVTEESDFDTASKVKKGPKPGKGKAGAAAVAATATSATGLGISTNGEPGPKRRKPVEKPGSAPGMARTASTQGKGTKSKESPRSTPLLEQGAKGKTAKPKPAPTKAKKMQPGSVQASPMLASSPLASSFNSAAMEIPLGARPTSVRIRRNSAVTNLRHGQLQDGDEADSRPISAAGKTNGQKTNGRRHIQETTEEHDTQAKDDSSQRGRLRDVSDKLKREDTEMRDASGNEKEHGNSRSGSDSRKGSGRASKMGTPRMDTFPSGAGVGGDVASKARGARSRLGDRDSTSSEPRTQGSQVSKHKRHASGSHLVKQLAPFNKSPNMDRHTLDDEDDDDESMDGEELANGGEVAEEDEDEGRENVRRSSTRRPASRRNTINSTTRRTSPGPASRESSPPPSPPPTSTRQTTRSSGRGGAVEVPLADEPPAVEDDDEESDHDPDDPDEPKYCYCNRGSYGEMIACDNDNCPREWFHLGCTELTEAPAEDKKWYCQDCRPKGRGRAKGGRGGRATG